MPDTAFSPRSYVLTFGALVLLTLGTVGLSFLRLGSWHLATGLAIAAAKAALVVLVFMHLARGSTRNWLAAALGLVWLAILLTLTLSDYLTRPQAAY
jgi:cytochrome c oxidase subunit 4